MKKIIYTQRVEIVKSYGERRDCADQNIAGFIQACGYLPIPIANVVTDIKQMIEIIKPDGIILTGGNSLVKYGGNAPERDETDKKLIEIAIHNNIPLYGFCRGMQSILDYYNCTLVSVKGHAAVRHYLNDELKYEVNSFHNEAAIEINKPLNVIAIAEDGVIEAVSHETNRICATMWHPEREKPFREEDIKRIQKLFG